MTKIVIIGLVVLGSLFLYVRHQFQAVGKAAANPTGTYVRPPLPDSSRLKCVSCGGSGRTMFFSGRSMERQYCSPCRGIGWVDNPAYVAMRRAKATPPKR